jgi:hypothetical protein
MIRRRSRLSANAPAGSEKNMSGNVAEAWTSATMLFESDMVVIIHAAATFWINPPRLDISVAIHSARNVEFLNGASDDARCGTKRDYLLLDSSTR